MSNNQFNLTFETDLNSGATTAILPMLFLYDDSNAHVFTVKTTRDGKANSLTGASVHAYFMPSNSEECVYIAGTVDDNGYAVVSLAPACYAFIGRFSLVIRAEMGDAVTSIFRGEGYVGQSHTDAILDPGDALHSLKELEARIEALDAAKAPAGFGLGGECITVDDWNNATQNGWYKAQNNSATGGWMFGYVVRYGAGALIQVAYNFATATSYGHARRMCYNGTFTDWEWVNPPMTLGVEYRTTERWNGKAVYSMCVSYGTAVNDASGALPDGATKLIRHAGMVGSYSLPVGNIVSSSAYAHSFYSTSGAKKLVLYADPTVFGSGAYTWYENLWYTKD